MTSSSRQAGPSPRSSEVSNHDTFPERHYDGTAAQDTDFQYLRDNISTPHPSGALYVYPGLPDRSHGNANDYNQYQDPYSNFQSETSVLRNRQPSEAASPFAQQNGHGPLRGIEDFAEAASPSVQGRELVRREPALLHGAPSPYNMPRRSESVASGSPALHPMLSFPHTSMEQGAGQGEEERPRLSKYMSCPSRLPDSASAREYRRQQTQFDRKPYRDPNTDETIADIENNRRVHVERIYNAMTSGEIARDNSNSIAVKRWITEAHYPPDLVEAFAHRVFDCLLDQVKYGFRGWVHNDYVADERKGEDVDREVDCAGRLDNIIDSLRLEKTICEDVLNSACQVRTFVNAPKAYASRKHQNRLGNSKRGRAKDAPDGNPKAAKAPRTGPKHKTRGRSNTASDMPSSRGNTPQYQQPQQQQQQTAAQLPYFSGSNFPNLSPGPITSGHLMPRFAPTHRSNLSAGSSYGQQPLAIMSPPPATSPQLPHASQLQIARTATMPPQHQSPTMTPPTPLSHGPYFASDALEEAKPAAGQTAFDSWNAGRHFDGIPYTSFESSEPAVDPKLTQMQWNFGGHSDEDGASNFLDHSSQYVNPADVERGHSLNGDTCFNFQGFGAGWGAHQDAQDFPRADGSPGQRH
jgi:hypothetical protein